MLSRNSTKGFDMKVWDCGKFVEVELGAKALVFQCGSGHSYFGEFATLIRTTKQHLVFETESGVIVKTSIDNINHVAGKAGKQGYCVSLNVEGREDDPNFFKQDVYIY